MVEKIQLVSGDDVKIKKDDETPLLDDLAKYNVLGEYRTQEREFYMSGDRKVELTKMNHKGMKEITTMKEREGSLIIDAVIKCSSPITYIVEAKKELKNEKAFEAVGKVFIYEYAYKEDPEHKQENTRKVIVCKEANEEDAVFKFCMANDIDIVEITDKDIKKNGKVIKEK